MAERICAFCNKVIEEGTAPVVCVRCHGLYHQECWQGLDRCAIYGCNEPKESYGLVDTSVTEMTCASCQQKNPRSVQQCLHCGAEVGAPIDRKVFVSFAGWRATTDEELVQCLNKHWDSGIRHLYTGDLEQWFGCHGHKDWAEKAKEIRLNNKQRSIGLETFLQSTGLVEQPTISINPPRLLLESSASAVETVIDITNEGRGYLFGTVKADVPWITCNEEEFSGNRNRIELRIDMEKLPTGTTEGSVTVSGAGKKIKVEIKATRIGIDNALAAFNAGDINKAKMLSRRLADSQSVAADTAMLLCACYLAEDNTSGAASILGKLTGACVKADNKVLESVYDWYKREGQSQGGLDHFAILEAMVPTAKGELAGKVKGDLAKLALEKVSDLTSSVDTGANLWQDSGDVKQSVNELLAMAVDLDPGVGSDADSLRRQYGDRVRRKGFTKVLLYLLVFALLGGAGYGLWWVARMEANKEMRPIEQALHAKNYTEALREAKVLCDNHPDEAKYFESYLKVLAARAQDEAVAKNWEAVNSTVNQMRGVVSEHFGLSKKVSVMVCAIAKAVEEAGLPTEARVHYQTASQLDPNNTDAAMSSARLSSATDLFWKVYSIANGELGHRVCDNCAAMETIKNDIAVLESLGVKCHTGQMQVMLRDLNGDGIRSLVVCGNDFDASQPLPSNTKGYVDVYDFSGAGLSKVYSDTVDYPWLLYLRAYDFSGQKRNDIAMAWAKDRVGKQKTVVLLAKKDGKFVSEAVPGSGTVEFADHDIDWRIEIWIPTDGSGNTSAKGGLIASPFVWMEPGFIGA
ncbi:hypothetical protein IJT17_07165, partial [bacterium]|nr:hypothetical protein [bacterium]